MMNTVLHLDPVLRATSPVAAVAALRNQTFEAMTAGRAEQDRSYCANLSQEAQRPEGSDGRWALSADGPRSTTCQGRTACRLLSAPHAWRAAFIDGAAIA